MEIDLSSLVSSPHKRKVKGRRRQTKSCHDCVFPGRYIEFLYFSVDNIGTEEFLWETTCSSDQKLLQLLNGDMSWKEQFSSGLWPYQWMKHMLLFP